MIDTIYPYHSEELIIGGSVLLSNHSEFDNAVNKNRMLAGRGNGPHPYETAPIGCRDICRSCKAAHGQHS